MKGRNSTVISVRLPDEVVATLAERAKGISIGEYIRNKIINSCSVNATTSVNTTDIPIAAPWYNPAIHRAGDTVRVKQGNRVSTVVIPELDADGGMMW